MDWIGLILNVSNSLSGEKWEKGLVSYEEVTEKSRISHEIIQNKSRMVQE